MSRKNNRIERAFEIAISLSNICSIDILRGRLRSYITRKKEFEQEDDIIYKRVMKMVKQNTEIDRTIPIQTIQVGKTSNSVSENAIIHYGPEADEMAFEINALAFAIGNNIYFRSGKYQPETEEGRMILAHELKHVEQYQEKRINQNSDKEELEREAENAEKKKEYDPDPYEMYPVGNKIFWFRKSEIEDINMEIADEIQEWIKEQVYVRDEEGYSKLILKYRNLLKRGL